MKNTRGGAIHPAPGRRLPCLEVQACLPRLRAAAARVVSSRDLTAARYSSNVSAQRARHDSPASVISYNRLA